MINSALRFSGFVIHKDSTLSTEENNFSSESDVSKT